MGQPPRDGTLTSTLKLGLIKSKLDQGRPSPKEVWPSGGFTHQRLGPREAWPTGSLAQGRHFMISGSHCPIGQGRIISQERLMGQGRLLGQRRPMGQGKPMGQWRLIGQRRPKGQHRP